MIGVENENKINFLIYLVVLLVVAWKIETQTENWNANNNWGKFAIRNSSRLPALSATLPSSCTHSLARFLEKRLKRDENMRAQVSMNTTPLTSRAVLVLTVEAPCKGLRLPTMNSHFCFCAFEKKKGKNKTRASERESYTWVVFASIALFSFSIASRLMYMHVE